MFWDDWKLEHHLALVGIVVASISLLVTVVITFIVHGLSIRAGKVGDEATQQIRRLQAQLFDIAQRGRRDELNQRLQREGDQEVVVGLVKEVEASYDGDDLRILRSVYRQNVATPLPSHGSLSQRDFIDYVRSLPLRLRSKGSQQDPIVQFVRHARENALEDRWELATAIYEGSDTTAPISHDFYRRVVSADWTLAPHLVAVVRDHFDWANPARSTNVLTGVFVALKDLDPRWPSVDRRVCQMTRDQDAELQKGMLQALAGLMHRGPLTVIGGADREKPLIERGATEHVSAMAAWMVLAAGNAVQDDEHLEMRLMESLPAVIESMRLSPDWRRRGCGIDDEDVQVGLLRMRHKCPLLWARHGEDLVRITGVPLDPRITRARDDSQSLAPSIFEPAVETWPEVYDVE